MQFLICLRKFELIVEGHLPRQLILCEIKYRLYVSPIVKRKRIQRNDFNKELKNGKPIFRCFSGANTDQLDHYILPLLVDDKPYVVIRH